MRNKIGILVIADALELRKCLRQNLEAQGFLVSEACEEADGLQTIDDGFQPQLVIADMDTRGMESFCANVTNRAIRVVALGEQGTWSGAALRVPMLQGVDAPLVKPFDDVFVDEVIRGLQRDHAGPAE